MAELKRSFIQGKMELDLDDRLVPQGTIRYGQNVTVSRSSTADVGALENVRGNRQIPTAFPLSSSYVCIGSVSDELNNKVYWFFIGPATEGIYEYDIENDNINRVLEFSRSRRIFNFSTEHFITGANVIGDFLAWTDNLNPPRLINIQRFVSSPREVVTLGGVQTIQVGSGRYFEPNTNGGYFARRQYVQLIQEDGNAGNPETTDGQTVITLRNIPSTSLAIVLDRIDINEVQVDLDEVTLDQDAGTVTLPNDLALAAGDYVRTVFEYASQEASNPSTPEGAGAELLSSIDPQYDNNGVPLVNLQSDDILSGDMYNATTMYNTGDTVIFQGSIYQSLTDNNLANTPNISPTDWLATFIQETAFHGDLINVAKRPPLQAPIVTCPERGDLTQGQPRIVQAQDGDYLYDNFVHFAYRYTYRDGQVTPLSPFSEAAFFPRPYQEDRASGGIPSMVNRFGKVLINYDVGGEEVTEIELVVISSRDLTVKSLATINKEQQGLESSNPYSRNIQTFTYDNNKVYSTLPSSELFRLYDNVPLRAQSQEIVGNRLVYGNYVQNYNLNKINGDVIVPSFNVDYDSIPLDSDKLDGVKSVKSDRDYQVGIVYLDREGRQTPVLLSDTPGNSSSVKVNFNDTDRPGKTHTNKNILTIDISSPAPTWATHYRFFVKQVQGTHYTVLPKDTFVSGGKVYLQLDSDDRNKIDADTEFVLKGSGNVSRDERSLWRIDPYVVDSSGQGNFSVTSDGQGGFNIEGGATDAVSFNIPFEEIIERTGNAFGSLKPSTLDVTLNTGDLSSQGYNPTVQIPDVESTDTPNVSSITVNGEEIPKYGTSYSSNINWTVQTGGRIYLNTDVFDDNVDIEVSYTVLVPDPDSPAKNDFYVAIVPQTYADINLMGSGDEKVILETVPDAVVGDFYYEHGETFRCINGSHTTASVEVVRDNDDCQELYGAGETIPDGFSVGDPVIGDNGRITVKLEKYFNCIVYPVGVEDQTIEGKFNNVSILPGIKASTTNELYREREQINWLIHSGVFSDDTTLNRLNEFNPGLPISSEIDIADGSIQKLHSRDTNLIVFQEDKVKNVPIQKDLILSADGGGTLATSGTFFGTESAYAGEWGISKNPESFSTYGNRIYFADKNRGALCRLGGDGITEISQSGAESYVRETIRDAELIIGSYDHFHDQAHFTFRNRPEAIPLTPNEIEITLSEEGRSGPRSECNRNHTLISFKTRYAYVSNESIGIQEGDVIFVDSSRTVQFNGDYRWYRIQDPDGTNPDKWNRAIQISPDGVVTGVENNCAVNRPPDIARQSFNISDVGYSSEFEACAFSIVNGIAYHNGAGVEPEKGDIVYEGRWDRIRSTRTGWYTITEGLERYVLLLCNGEVMDKVDCEEISRDRSLILGSNPQLILEGSTEAFIIDEVCTEPFAEQFYWYEGNGDLPGAGMKLYVSNHTDDLATSEWYEDDTDFTGETRYYTFPNGYYVQVDDTGTILPGFPKLCSERVCFVNPNTLVQDDTDQFVFEFQGVDRYYYFTTFDNEVEVFDTTLPVANAEISYIVQGERRYPRTGTFKVNQEIGTGEDKRYTYDFRVTEENRYMRLEGDVVDPLGLSVLEEVTLPKPNDAINLSTDPYPEYAEEDEDNVRVIVTGLCYRIPIQTVAGAEVIEATDPTAAITGSRVGETGVTNVLLSAAQSDGGLFRGGAVAGISSYSWSTSTGQTGTEETFTVNHRDSDGVINVTLEIQSANGRTDSATYQITYSTTPPNEYNFSATLADNHDNAVVVGTFATITGIENVGESISRTLQVRPQTGYEWTGTGTITIGASPTLPSGVTFGSITQPASSTNGIVEVLLSGTWTPTADYTGTFTWNIPSGAIQEIVEEPSRVPAWIAPVPTEVGEVCGMQNVSAVYYLAADNPRVYTEDAAGEVAFSSAAGLYGVADTEPVGGQAVVTHVQNIAANGTVLSSGGFTCVNNNPTYVNTLGFTAIDSDAARQGACLNARNMTNLVTVYSNSQQTNFSDDPPTDPDNPGNPPTRFQTASGGTVEDGYYTNGDVIRLVTNGVVGGILEDCSFSLLATLSVTNNITVPSPGVVPITLTTDQGTSVTWSSNPASLSDTGSDAGDTWEITTTVGLPEADGTATNGYEWTDGPYVSVDGGTATAITVNSSGVGSVVYEGTFSLSDLTPSQTHLLTGTIGARAIPPPPPTTYNAEFTFSEAISNAAISGSPTFTGGHTWTQVNSTTWRASDIPLAESGTCSVTIATSENYVWDSLTVNGSAVTPDSTESHTASVNYSRTATEPSIAFGGSTTFVAPEETYTLSGTAYSGASGSAEAANVSVSSDSDAISSGMTTLEVTLSADAGWRIVQSTPGTLTQSVVFTYPTAAASRSLTRDWTNVSAERYSHTVTEVGATSEGDACPTGTSTTIYTGSDTFNYSGDLYATSTSASKDTSTRYFRVGTTIHIYTNGVWTTTTCSDEPPRSTTVYRQASSLDGACSDATSTDITLYLGDDGTWYLGDVGDNRRPSTSQYYGIGFTVYTFDSGGVRSSGERCPGVYVSGSRVTGTISGLNATSFSSGSATVEVIDVTATFQANFNLTTNNLNGGETASLNNRVQVGGSTVVSQSGLISGFSGTGALTAGWNPTNRSFQRGNGTYSITTSVGSLSGSEVGSAFGTLSVSVSY